jgi:hypothetical protein
LIRSRWNVGSSIDEEPPVETGHLNLMGRIGLVLGCIASAGIVAMVVLIRTALPAILDFNAMGYILGIGYLYLLLYHGFVFLHAILILFSEYKSTPLHIGVVVLGFVSGFLFIVEKVMFDEIAREMVYEFPVPGEIVFIYGALGVHLLFTALAFVSMVRSTGIRNDTE